ncbi:KAD8 kinase, partial [Centropus bengalensis]|nr:KAD8 kinase [Centropus bengalensis]
GWVLEGLPENQEQAWMLQSSGVIPRHVGKQRKVYVYHTTFDWPSDPLIRQRLVTPGDMSEHEMSKRLLEYHRNLPGVFQIYQKVLKSINADQPSVDV